MVIVIARFRPRPERRDDLLALLAEVQEASRQDDGCLNYGYYENITEASSFVAVEEWRDMDALAAHLRTEHVARLIAAIGQMAEQEAFEIAAHEVARSGPLPLPT
jgi:quinol monooxygenase YgiN